MTLVETALSTPRKRNPKRKHREDSATTQEMVDLSVLWVFDRVSFGQCAAATGRHNNNMYSHLAWGLREAARQGRLVDSKSVRGWK